MAATKVFSGGCLCTVQAAGLLVQGGFQLRKLLGLFLQGYGVLGLGVCLLLQQCALVYLMALCELLQCILQLELSAVTVSLRANRP